MAPAATAAEFSDPRNYDDQSKTSTSSPYHHYSGTESVNSTPKFVETASAYGNAGEEYGFNTGRSFPGAVHSTSSQSVRSRPRLVKLRKGSSSARGTASSLTSNVNPSVINPFVSTAPASDQKKDNGGAYQGNTETNSLSSGRSNSAGFVFGDSNSFLDTESKFINTNSEDKDCISSNLTNNVAQELSGALQKSAIDGECANKESVACTDSLYVSSSANVEPHGDGEKNQVGNDCDSWSFVQAGFVFGSSFNENKKEARRSRGRAALGTKTRGKHNQKAGLEKHDIPISMFDMGSDISAPNPNTSRVHGKKQGAEPKLSSKVDLSNVMKNLNINNLEKPGQSHYVPLSSIADVFMPRSTEENYSFSQDEPTTSRSSVHNSHTDRKSAEPGRNGGTSAKPASGNVYIFGSSSGSSNGKVESPVAIEVNSSNVFGVGKDYREQTDDHFSSSEIYGEERLQSIGANSKQTENVHPHVFQSGASVLLNFGVDPTTTDKRKVDFSFEGTSDLPGASKTDFKAFSFSASNSFNKKAQQVAKSRVSNDPKSYKTKRKPLQKNIGKHKSLQEPLPDRYSPQVNSESNECYSPMDFSPYEECKTADEFQQEHPAQSRSSFTETRSSFSKCNMPSSDGMVEDAAASYDNPPTKPFPSMKEFDTATADADASLNTSHQDYSEVQFHVSSSVGNRTENFMFTASTSPQGQPSTNKLRQKKKYRMKNAYTSPGMATCDGSSFSKAPLVDKLHSSNPESREKKFGADEEEMQSGMNAAEKACEKWRLRGNDAYKNEELSKAEGFYTWGINCIPSGERAAGSSVKLLVLCYSNRAATRMAIGRVREALQDCLVAIALDPDFIKARIRAANCHLMLGELDDAIENFENCLKSGGVLCLDRQVAISASDGLQKAQKVMEHASRSEELLKMRTPEAAVTTLDLINQSLSISSHSEKLLQLKADTLLVLQRYDEAMQLCHQTLDFAERNFSSLSPFNYKGNDSDSKNHLDVRGWRNQILAKCYFHLGKFDASLDVLDKLESSISGPSESLAVTIHDLLKHKKAGNEAFQAGKHAEAIEHYTSAILSSTESRPFAAVCFGNRAAAHQALGQLADAIADCSLAIALDENYAKAVSRRATLHEMIRDYRQTASDLERLVSILEKKSQEKSKQSGSGGQKELRQANQRLLSIEEKAKKEIPLDMYLILGVKRSDTSAEIKKAYRKAALRHHPDKAAQSLGRSENGDDGRCWKDIADLVRRDSDRLFKMIGEAYAVLSDPEQRSDYDLKEEFRNASTESNSGRSASRRQKQPDDYSYYYSSSPPYPFRSSNSRRYWQDGYSHSYRVYKNSSSPKY